MAAKLVSEVLLSSLRSGYYGLLFSTKQNILLHIVALEEAYQELFVPQVEILANEGIFNEYITSQSCFAIFLSEIGSYQLAIV